MAEEFRTRWVAAFEENGIDGVKHFFKEWDAEHPSPQRGRKKTAAVNKSTSARSKAKKE